MKTYEKKKKMKGPYEERPNKQHGSLPTFKEWIGFMPMPTGRL